MATRGRPNVSAKKTTSKIAPKQTAKQKKTKTGTKGGLIETAKNKAKEILKGKGKGTGGGGQKTAKQLLKRAYEKRAKRFIRLGNLGQARRILRKKQTVV